MPSRKPTSWWGIILRTILLGMALGFSVCWLMSLAGAEDHRFIVKPNICLTAGELSEQTQGQEMVAWGIGRTGPLIILLTASNGDFTILFRPTKNPNAKACYLVTGTDWTQR